LAFGRDGKCIRGYKETGGSNRSIKGSDKIRPEEGEKGCSLSLADIIGGAPEGILITHVLIEACFPLKRGYRLNIGKFRAILEIPSTPFFVKVIVSKTTLK
jgi:hypothetical protein